MIAFNTWYYSFSPSVASHLQTDPAGRTVMKVVLYPLIGMLWMSSATFNLTQSYPEIAALLSGLVASSLIGAFYLGVPFGFLRSRVKRLRDSRRQKMLRDSLLILLLLGLGGLAIGELLAAYPLLIASTVTVILSTLLLNATIASNKIAELLNRKIRTV